MSISTTHFSDSQLWTKHAHLACIIARQLSRAGDLPIASDLTNTVHVTLSVSALDDVRVQPRGALEGGWLMDPPNASSNMSWPTRGRRIC